MRKMEFSGITVGEAMTINPVICSPEINAKEAAKIMIKNHVGSLVVAKNKKLMGIITEKDMLNKLIANAKSPEKVLVKDIMTKKPISIGRRTDIAEALDLMIRNDFRRLPVVENNSLVGIITEKDLLRIAPKVMDFLITKKKIKEINRKPIKIREVQGMCEECGNFSGELVDKNGIFICHDCEYSA
ncbi:MAG: CBS domain-containing protein [Candidatus Nanoarchaeia archaeon]|nr:CBS domain-containing protein [Candidatus Nanoarchaeia archaeon]